MSGNFWLFGGDGCDSVDSRGQLNDLWRYDTTMGEWTWISGSDIIDQVGTYGTKGTPAAANIPGARYAGTSWVDLDGDFWLFGGYGPDSTETWGDLNDLWCYDTTIGEWTWVSGSDTMNQVETYGIKGTPATDNIPGARSTGTSWVDTDGDFWLFGGLREVDPGSFRLFNDLWRYDSVAPSVSTTTTTTTTTTTPATSPGWTFTVFSVALIAVTQVKRLYRKDD